MKTNKKIIYIILIFLIFFYYAIGSIINSSVYAATTKRSRSTDLTKLNNEDYPGFLTIINKLKEEHPNWEFTILYTGLDWSTVIKKETTALHGRSLVQNSSSEWICSVCGSNAYDNGTWYCASAKTVKYYMDARNWMTEDYIFAFEALSFDESIQTVEGVEAILKDTFMDKDTITYINTSGKTKTINKSYAEVIMEAAKEYNVSPYHLASRIRQEQGVDGTSTLISGKCTYKDSEGKSLKGYYNYFNIGASGSGSKKICINGLTYAKSQGWTNPELAIKGGASFIASGYIDNYQDSLYLEKYQVDSKGGLYSHQYMQNVSAPYSEGYSVYKAYKEIGVLENKFNFIIPVYENMPTTISQKPTVTVDIVTENVKISTSSTNLPLRASTSANSTKIIDLPKNAVVLRIEKATSKQNGYYWDKIVYDSGEKIYIGYANSEYLTRVDDVITTNLLAEVVEGLNLRNGPGLIDTTVKKTLPVGTEVTILDEMTYKINGSIWYRVKLSDNTQGYVVSSYLKMKEFYKLDGENMIVAPTTTLEDIENATSESKSFGTGAEITLEDKTYILIMLGDVNGDGQITSADYVRVKNHLRGTTTLTESQKQAADSTFDGNVTSADYVRIKNYLRDKAIISI